MFGVVVGDGGVVLRRRRLHAAATNALPPTMNPRRSITEIN
jgi:hypothetical protein